MHHSESPLATQKSDEMASYPDEKFIEDAHVPNSDGMTEAERAATLRRLLFKLDIRIIPVFALLFLCSFLDRTNAGNAKTYGLEKDLYMTDHEYDIGLTVYYATYIASEIPSNLILKKVSPKIWLPSLTIAWGIVTMCLGFVRNYAGFVSVRAILGVAEGGLLPGMVLYLSGMYTRGEMALRLGLFYTSASLSGAFGGLLARGLSSIGDRAGLYDWSWIFVIEGLITVVVGIVSYFFLPNNVESCKFLSEKERTLATERLHNDTPSKLADDGT
ncbi:major facilitator superfamily transporter [Phlyctema vagabunda]|uniref:Major facilitator superfamily transporter n=1 Tax=Phlyctema vagabunda TaxID=108571 RepID=A0ABR4PTZ6_9HELO